MSSKERSNPEKVLDAILEFGSSNKWDLQNSAHIAYPRVNESINSLKKANLIRVVDTKFSEKNVKMPIYDLTFKGFITLLAVFNLNRPRYYIIAEEKKTDISNRLNNDNKKYISQLEKLTSFLQRYGKKHDFVIFKELYWLVENYGIVIYDFILTVSKIIQKPEVLKPYKILFKLHKSDEQEYSKTLKMIEKYPSLRKQVIFTSTGKGDKKEIEFDILTNTKNRLGQLNQEFSHLQKEENKFLRDKFSINFLEKIAYIKRKNQDENTSLRNLAKCLLEKKKLTIAPLEKIVKELGNLKNEVNKKD